MATKLRNDVSAVNIRHDPNGGAEEPLLTTGSAKSADKPSLRIKLLQAAIMVITDNKVTILVEADSSWEVEESRVLPRRSKTVTVPR